MSRRVRTILTLAAIPTACALAAWAVVWAAFAAIVRAEDEADRTEEPCPYS